MIKDIDKKIEDLRNRLTEIERTNDYKKYCHDGSYEIALAYADYYMIKLEVKRLEDIRDGKIEQFSWDTPKKVKE